MNFGNPSCSGPIDGRAPRYRRILSPFSGAPECLELRCTMVKRNNFNDFDLISTFAWNKKAQNHGAKLEKGTPKFQPGSCATGRTNAG
jgi:hypothetical protein